MLSRTEQVGQLRLMVEAFYDQGKPNKGQTKLTKLDQAQKEADKGNLKVVHNVLGAFRMRFKPWSPAKC